MQRVRLNLIFAIAIAITALTLAGCADDGSDGQDGAPGADGAPGEGLVPIEPPTLFGHTQQDVLVAYDVEAAYNNDTFFWRLTFDAAEGKRHDYYRYTNGAWQTEGGDARDAQATIDGDDAQGAIDVKSTIYETRTSIMMSDPTASPRVTNFDKFGCFVACHNQSRHMPEWTDADGEDGKWVEQSLVTGATGDDKVLDLWHWRAARSNPIAKSDDQYIRSYAWTNTPGVEDTGRLGDAGTGVYTTNNLVGGNPSNVFDPTTALGLFAFNWEEFWDTPAYYITSAAARLTNKAMSWANALTAGYWPTEGDVVPLRLLRDTAGSRGDITATGTIFTPDPGGEMFNGDRVGTWEVQLQRALTATNTLGDDVNLVAGNTYNVGFEMHTWAYTTRDHYVSFPMTVKLGTGAVDIQAYDCGLNGDCATTGATPPTWANSTAVRIYLFQPGINTWEFLTGANTAKTYIDPVTGAAVNQTHGGSSGISGGTACRSCHRVRVSDTGGTIGGPMETLTGQRGGIFAPTPHE